MTDETITTARQSVSNVKLNNKLGLHYTQYFHVNSDYMQFYKCHEKYKKNSQNLVFTLVQFIRVIKMQLRVSARQEIQ